MYRLSQQCARAPDTTCGPSLVLPAVRAPEVEAADVGAATQRQDVVNVLPSAPTLEPLISRPGMRIVSSEEDAAPCTNTWFPIWYSTRVSPPWAMKT
jgi:hypothetical protein